MENKVKVWIARDESGYALVHFEKPYKSTERGFGEWVSHGSKAYIKEFPSIKWEDDEPTEAYITLAEPQEQPTTKQEIDWEQRRYEIARDMLRSICANAEILHYNELAYVKEAIELADILIKELMGGEQ